MFILKTIEEQEAMTNEELQVYKRILYTCISLLRNNIFNLKLI